MNVEIKITMGDTTCSAGLDAIPGPVQWTGDEELIDYAKDKLERSHGAVGHPFDLQYTGAADLVAAVGLLFGDQAELKRGRIAFAAEDREIDRIEAEGAS